MLVRLASRPRGQLGPGTINADRPCVVKALRWKHARRLVQKQPDRTSRFEHPRTPDLERLIKMVTIENKYED